MQIHADIMLLPQNRLASSIDFFYTFASEANQILLNWVPIRGDNVNKFAAIYQIHYTFVIIA
jgi:hypothetical protein